MSRLRRPFLYDRYIFVTVKLLRSRAVLESPDYERLAASLARLQRKHGFAITARVFLPGRAADLKKQACATRSLAVWLRLRRTALPAYGLRKQVIPINPIKFNEDSPMSSENPSKNKVTPNAERKPNIQARNSNPSVPSSPSPSELPPADAHYTVTCDTEKDWWDRHKRWVEMFGVLLLAVYTAYTIKMYRANRDAADAAASAAKTAHDALVFGQRPWVGISGNDSFRLQLAKGGPLKVVLISKNFGTTPALKESSVNKMEEVGPTGHTPNFATYTRDEAGPPVVLFPGSASTIQIDTAKPSAQGNLVFTHLTEEEIREIKTGVFHIYLFGSIWYEDTFHESHRTDYCFMFDPETSNEATSSFIACSEHNYAD